MRRIVRFSNARLRQVAANRAASSLAIHSAARPASAVTARGTMPRAGATSATGSALPALERYARFDMNVVRPPSPLFIRPASTLVESETGTRPNHPVPATDPSAAARPAITVPTAPNPLENVATLSRLAADIRINDWMGHPRGPAPIGARPTESEADVAADRETGPAADPLLRVRPRPTESEEDVDADRAGADPLLRVRPRPTESEEDVRADRVEMDPLRRVPAHQ